MAETTATLLQRVEAKVDHLTVQVAEMRGSLLARVDQHEHELEDHERRIRSLERFRYAMPSAAVISCLAAVGVLLYYLVHG